MISTKAQVHKTKTNLKKKLDSFILLIIFILLLFSCLLDWVFSFDSHEDIKFIKISMIHKNCDC